MKICSKCHSEIKDDANFCTKCGAKVDNNNVSCSNKTNDNITFNDANSASNAEATTELVNNNDLAACYESSPALDSVSNNLNNGGFSDNSNIKRTMPLISKTQKIVICAIAALIVIVVGCFVAGQAFLGKSAQISQFEKAIQNQDADTLVKYLSCSDSKVKIDKDSAKSLITYLENNKTIENNIFDSLKNGDGTNSFVSLKKNGSKFLFFTNYTFDVVPSYVTVSVNASNAKIYVNNTYLCTSDSEDFSKKVGPFILGTYTVKGVLKSNYANISKNQTTDILPGINFCDVKLPAVALNINCSISDATVVINGKETNVPASDAQKIGDVSNDGSTSLCLEKDFAWGKTKTTPIKVTDDGYMNIDFTPDSQDLTNSIITTMSAFEKNNQAALSSLDASKLTNATDSERQAISNNIDSMKDLNQQCTSKLNKVTLGLDSLVINKDATDSYYVEVTVKENDTNTQDQSVQDNIMKYDLVYDAASKTWNVNDSESGYQFTDKNVKDVPLN
jgi:uncharacterized membrane protein YvbJ